MNNYKKTVALLFVIGALLLVGNGLLYSWGFFAHKFINRLAVFTLPKSMIGFYKSYIEYIAENAVAPDRRRHSMQGEPPRHYIDIDHYGDHPFDSMPEKWNEAVNKYSEDSLMAYGIVPWHISNVTRWLAEAFRNKDLDKILYHSADLGHYVADAHVPLHVTENYNGQMTNQKGIHGFWESRLPELFSADYNFFVGKAMYIENPLNTAWDIIKESYMAKDSVLLFEAKLNANYSPDRKYSFESSGAQTNKVYSKEYAKEYHDLLNGMVERRMRAAIIMVGSFWYTAWVNAGKPNLKDLQDKEMSKELKKQLKEEENMWKTGKILGSEHDD